MSAGAPAWSPNPKPLLCPVCRAVLTVHWGRCSRRFIVIHGHRWDYQRYQLCTLNHATWRGQPGADEDALHAAFPTLEPTPNSTAFMKPTTREAAKPMP